MFSLLPLLIPMAVAAAAFSAAVHAVGEGKLGLSSGLIFVGMLCGGLASNFASREIARGRLISSSGQDILAFLMLAAIVASGTQFYRSWIAVESGWGYPLLIWAGLCFFLLILIPFKFKVAE